jgi:hypothetical protein
MEAVSIKAFVFCTVHQSFSGWSIQEGSGKWNMNHACENKTCRRFLAGRPERKRQFGSQGQQMGG